MLAEPLILIMLLLSWALPVLVIGYLIYLIRNIAVDIRSIAVEVRHLRQDLAKANVE